MAELGRSSRNHKAHKIDYELHLVTEKVCLSLVQFLTDRKEGRDCAVFSKDFVSLEKFHY